MKQLIPLYGVALIGVLCSNFMLLAEPPKPVKHVVLVSIDGLAASYLDDARAELPTLRKLRKQGASAKGMITTFPSVTWPSHTTLVTGVTPAKHGVLGNSVWNREANRNLVYIGDPELTKEEAIRVPTLYDLASESGLTTAGVIWPCVNGAKTLNWTIPDAGKPEIHAKYTTPGLIEELSQAKIDATKLGEWGWSKDKSIARDTLYTQVANYLLEKHGVNLLLVHLITPDGVEHAYGPHTPQAYQAVKDADAHVAEIWATLQKAPFAGNSALFVVSDHGFAPYEKFIRPNALFQEMGLVKVNEDNKPTERSVWCVAQGGSAFIYILEAAQREELTKNLMEKLGQQEGITAVVEPENFAKYGLPDPKKNPESPDLVLLTGPGYSFNDALTLPVIADAGGQKGTHGHDPAPEYMHATFIAAGAGIQPTQLDQIRNLDIAPTIARLMGLEMKNVEGRVLEEIFEK